MKKIIMLFIIPFIFCSCQKNNIKYSQSENSFKECNKEILELIENKKFDIIISRDDNIIKNSYSDKRIEEIIKDLENKKYKNIYDVAKDYCIEYINENSNSVRKGYEIEDMEGKIYNVWIVGETRSVIVHFALNEKVLNDKNVETGLPTYYNPDDYVGFSIKLISDKTIDDFMSLSEKKDTSWKDVEKLDQSGDYHTLKSSGFSYTIYKSYHFSKDGYFITIYYKDNYNDNHNSNHIIDYIEYQKVY